MKHVFIINPVSGVGEYKKVMEWVAHNFQKKDFEIHVTKYPGHAKSIASQYGAGNILYAVGGDGTAFEVINGMDFNNEFCVIPVGTGNDFFKMIPFEGSLEDLLHATVYQAKTEMIDIGQVNDNYFLNFTSIGLDADVNYRAEKLKENKLVPRQAIYMVSALREIATLKSYTIDLVSGDLDIQKDISLVSIMNGKYYGGAFKSAPMASITDGVLDVCVVDGLTRRRASSILPKYMKGTHVDLDEVNFYQLQEFEIRSKKPLKYSADGEVFVSDILKVKMHHAKLKYRLPESINLNE